MGIEVNGTSLDSLVWNVRTRAGRMATAGRRGSNITRAGLDGTSWQPGKPLDELAVTLSMWIIGSDPYGQMPHQPLLRRRVMERYDELVGLVSRQDELVQVVDTDTGRRCFGELVDPLEPEMMAGGTRAEVEVPLVVPAGCWEDVDTFDSGAAALTSQAPVTLSGAGGSTLPTTGLVVTLTPPARNVRITTSRGEWVLYAGDLPTGADTVLDLNPSDPTATVAGDPVSRLAAVTWSGMVPLPVPPGRADPVVTVAAENTSGASQIRFTGRRRWHSA